MDPTTEQRLADAARVVTEARSASRQAIEVRNRLIIEAYRQSAGLREIARVAGLTHPQVRTIVRRLSDD